MVDLACNISRMNDPNVRFHPQVAPLLTPHC
jgi:hypothetical protein